MAMSELTQTRLKELLRYDPETGHFWWLRSGPGRKPGRPAGCVNAIGYVVIRVDDQLHLGHRLSWLYMTGGTPPEVDHADRNRANNSWENLREATRTLNNANAKRRSDNTSGFKGVWHNKERGTFQAFACANGRRQYLGTYRTATEAHEAYKSASAALHGEFAHGGQT